MPQSNESAVHITLYDMSGAPLDPAVLDSLLPLVDSLADKHKLTVNIAKG